LIQLPYQNGLRLQYAELEPHLAFPNCPEQYSGSAPWLSGNPVASWNAQSSGSLVIESTATRDSPRTLSNQQQPPTSF